MLICQMVKIASGKYVLFLKITFTLVILGHFLSTNVFIVVLFSAFLLLKNFIDGKKSSLCGPVNKFKNEGCFLPGLHVLKWEAVEACSISV